MFHIYLYIYINGPPSLKNGYGLFNFRSVSILYDKSARKILFSVTSSVEDPDFIYLSVIISIDFEGGTLLDEHLLLALSDIFLLSLHLL